jgi:hypothetical protein
MYRSRRAVAVDAGRTPASRSSSTVMEEVRALAAPTASAVRKFAPVARA